MRSGEEIPKQPLLDITTITTWDTASFQYSNVLTKQLIKGTIPIGVLHFINIISVNKIIYKILQCR